MTTRFTLFIAAVATIFAALTIAFERREGTNMAAAATPTTATPARSGRAEINGISYYYEIHGVGEPLLLLHGGLGSIDMFGAILPQLAASRQVIGVDLHGHGRTTLGERELSIVDMGDDLAILLEKLGYQQVDALGYSLGSGVAFRLAVQHPDRVRRLALVSARYSRDAFYPEILAQQGQMNAAAAEFMKETPMYQSYMAIAPNPEDFPRLLDRIGASMSRDFDWANDVKRLTMPTMLVYGDSDAFRPEHMISFYQLLGGGLRDAGWTGEHQSPNRLAILPGRTHYDIFMAPELVTTVLPFLENRK
jgi:pimeloyl-ACP methyl ester carboxylesterase